MANKLHIEKQSYEDSVIFSSNVVPQIIDLKKSYTLLETILEFDAKRKEDRKYFGDYELHHEVLRNHYPEIQHLFTNPEVESVKTHIKLTQQLLESYINIVNKVKKIHLAKAIIKELSQISKDLDEKKLSPLEALYTIKIKLITASEMKGYNRGIFNPSRIFDRINTAIESTQAFIIKLENQILSP